MPTSTAALLDAKDKHRVQSISGTFLYYSKIYPCIKPDLKNISTEQSAPTEDKLAKTNMLMDYLVTYPGSIIRYHASDMIINIEADSAYLVLPKARTRVAAWFIFGNDPEKVPKPMTKAPFHVMYNTIKSIMSSADEVETGVI